MEALRIATYTTPIIDNHAHNLLVDYNKGAYDLLSITSEASGAALQDSVSTLAHLRAVKQLSNVLGCEPTWQKVQEAIGTRRLEPNDAWSKECFAGIETALIDDGLDPSNVHPYAWHDRLTRSKCKRIVRIERVAEGIIDKQLNLYRKGESCSLEESQLRIIDGFISAIEEAIASPNVAGFKSVICYRTGLNIPAFEEAHAKKLKLVLEDRKTATFPRLEDVHLGPFFLHLTAQAIERKNSKKPLQFHTGLGDNDIDLVLSNPSLLQTFIKTYSDLNIVLLHASYPFTTRAGYLASVYENCYLDIGEVFPFLSQDGQERVIRDALDLCPSRKLLWSTDGHWFPESYLLAVIQVREGLEQVLGDYVSREALTVPQAIKIVQDILFNTANQLYGLRLLPTPFSTAINRQPKGIPLHQSISPAISSPFERFLDINPSVKFLRLQWLDYTSTLRVRILPINQALQLFRQGKFIGITRAVFGLLQTDQMCPGFSATGEYHLCPDFRSLRLASRAGHAAVQCQFRKKDGSRVDICPRSILLRQIETARGNGVEFLIGFEIEIVFIQRKIVNGGFAFGTDPVNDGGHAWSTARALQPDYIMDLLEAIAKTMEQAGIELQQFHPENAPGQYEFILCPRPPLEAVDSLIAAREIISSAVADAGMRATLYPRPFPTSCGTGAHIHISMTPEDKWQSFYAGILKNLNAMSAILYSNDASYERVVDGAWSGSTWIAWGPQNRETPLRRIEGSHFEIKCVDGLANPYLALAVIIGIGLQGVLRKTPLQMQPCLVDPAQLGADKRKSLGIRQQFPTTLGEALQILEGSSDIAEVLGSRAVETYLLVKEAEWRMQEKMEPAKRRNWLMERY